MKSFMTLIVTAAVLAATATIAMADGAKIAVVGGKTDDPFFAKVKKGIDDGALVVKAHGGSVNYLQLQTYDNIGGDAANLFRTAISQKVSVIAVPDWVPGSEDEAIKAAQAAGIPVILFNSGGGDKAKELGAINYVGNEEYPAGLAGSGSCVDLPPAFEMPSEMPLQRSSRFCAPGTVLTQRTFFAP